MSLYEKKAQAKLQIVIQAEVIFGGVQNFCVAPIKSVNFENLIFATVLFTRCKKTANFS